MCADTDPQRCWFSRLSLILNPTHIGTLAHKIVVSGIICIRPTERESMFSVACAGLFFLGGRGAVTPAHATGIYHCILTSIVEPNTFNFDSDPVF